MIEHLFIYNTDFKPWSIQHVVPLLLFTLVGYLFIRWGQKTTNTRAKWRAPFLWSLLLPASIILWILIRLVRGEFDVNDDIPLHMCNLVTFFLPLTFLKKRKLLFGILYLWVMSGTLQAVLTPGLEQAFPHYWYFRYWLIHCGLVIFILYGIIVLEYRVEPKHILYAFLALNGLFLFAHGFNYIVGSNYLYTMAKPDQPSLLDFFGPWPWYILTSEFVGLLFFIFYYTPFLYLSRKSNRSK